MLEEGTFQAGAERVGRYLHERLTVLRGRAVTAVRGRGVWAGVDVDPAVGSARLIAERLVPLGVLMKDTHVRTLRIAPSLVIDETQVDVIVGALERALQAA